MTSLFLAVLYLSFLGLGLPDSLLGSAWPVMQGDFAVPLAYAGYISMIVSCGTVCASIFTERIVKRTGTGLLVVGSTLLTAIAMFGFALSGAPWLLFLFAVPYGLGAGGIDVSLNDYVALNLKSRHMNWLHCTWGLGAIVSPYIMSWALLHRGWRSGYLCVGVLQTLITALLALSLPMWKRRSSEAAASRPVIGFRRAMRIEGVPRRLLAALAYSAISACCQLWPSSYLVYARHVSEERAAAFASLFFLGMAAGRFLFGFVSDRLGHRRIVRVGTAGILLGILCVILPVRHELPALAGFLIIGLGCSPIFPSFIHSTPERFGVENAQAVIGMEMGGAYLSSFLMPPLVGLLAGRFGIGLLPMLLLMFTLLMFALAREGGAVK